MSRSEVRILHGSLIFNKVLNKNYEFIEHTADISIRIKAKDIKALFKNAAEAMFDVIAEKRPKTIDYRPKAKEIVIEQRAGDLKELLVNWLNELLSLSATKEIIFSNFKINKLDNQEIGAIVKGEDIKNYRINTEIKAATYHQLKIEKIKAGWQAEVIFDV